MKFFYLCLLLVLPTGLFAQEYGDSLSHHQIGFSASTISSYGITYSYIFNTQYRIKSTLLGIYQDHGAYSDWTGILGLELQATLESGQMTRFYGFLGGSFYKYVDNNHSYYSYNDEDDFALGLGIGFEVLLWKHIAINLDLGVQYWSFKHYNFDAPFITKYFGPAGGIGINYRF